MVLERESIERVRRMVGSLERASGQVWNQRDDLEGEGLLGLAEATSRYDSGRGADFWTYVYLRVRGRVVDSRRKAARRLSAAPTAAPSTAEGWDDETAPGPTAQGRQSAADCAGPTGQPPRSMESTLTSREASRVLAHALASLPVRQRMVVVECKLKRRSITDTADKLALTRIQASRMLERGLVLLRRHLESSGYSLQDFV
ncbi:MAG: sigma-70 family RNA polymerase sigma factor [Deltaproteobacteria bacterium]|nr:sigma-70 family RNA polymerase sigma factor [Deltaproteobacteria bacterium]